MTPDHDPYQAPRVNLEAAVEPGTLAGRGARLAAAIIDGLILMVLLVPLMFVGGYIDAVQAAAGAGEQVPWVYVAMWTMIGFGVFVALQAVPLHRSGQTWGKRLLKIRIVDLEGRKPPLGRLLTLRYLPVQAASAVPVLGQLLPLVNVLFIFREDRRCAHDLLAGTRVVVAE